ncbi:MULTISPECIES: hypothetical protein [Bradyrhizobium]|jgi:hypothetical protein|uniref:hypothetical protein n=1 Tax=Bradyrhizobium TaxID=374 RepID=UPI000481958F|nr:MULTISPECIES: hypothetical protein [Bradyrhizobium]MCS3449567.1 hypothetical protein [Bradyrhizobium elkanii]MCS3559290.1 hypothetical protein [Bradyrhizobium elkanii]MCW2150864.1 hypothetical protein [Bradyrhizobium elkanii]MCW2374595.1 hypothetical protein [Bradyrhizobium elkanii]MDI2109556.1 hypothetical protein [Bradyrhizobium sp. Mp64]
MRDISQNLGFAQSVAPSVLTASANGASVDTLNFESAALVVSVGAVTGAFSAKLQDSPDGTTFSDIAPGLLVGALPGTLVANTVIKQGYLGSQKYLRAVLTSAGGTSIAVAATILLGSPKVAPVA